MSRYQTFIFESYVFDPANKQLVLRYSLDGELHFQESYDFDFDFADYNSEALDKVFQQLFFMAGVSYYKTYLPEKIGVKAGSISPAEAEFYAKTYQKGLGEFFYVNNLDPQTSIEFPVNSDEGAQKYNIAGEGLLVSVGGGKDSLVSIELLKQHVPGVLETWSLNHKSQLSPLVERVGTKHYYVGRTWDEKLNTPGALPESFNGHVPISAIFACVGVIVAILTGRRDVVMSNERSADEPTLSYKDTDINHQYSKSSEFERDFQSQIGTSFGGNIRYYSLLRPLAEIQIAKIFGNGLFEKYKDVFSSCNRAFVHGNSSLFWDGECPKCAFVYLMLSEYVDTSELDILMNGNMLLKPQLETTYQELLGITRNKPLECVGEIAESRWVMDRRKADFSVLKKYKYQSIADQEVFYLAASQMPDDIKEKIMPVFEQIAVQK